MNFIGDANGKVNAMHSYGAVMRGGWVIFSFSSSFLRNRVHWVRLSLVCVLSGLRCLGANRYGRSRTSGDLGVFWSWLGAMRCCLLCSFLFLRVCVLFRGVSCFVAFFTFACRAGIGEFRVSSIGPSIFSSFSFLFSCVLSMAGSVGIFIVHFSVFLSSCCSFSTFSSVLCITSSCGHIHM